MMQKWKRQIGLILIIASFVIAGGGYSPAEASKLVGRPMATGNHIYLRTHPDGQMRLHFYIQRIGDTLYDQSGVTESRHCDPKETSKAGAVALRFCVDLGWINVTIPDDLANAPDEWEFGGFKYRIVARDVYRVISGRWHEELYIIETEAAASARGRDTGQVSWSFVSDKLGVLGFGYVHKDGYLQEPIFELQGPIGMGYEPNEDYHY